MAKFSRRTLWTIVPVRGLAAGKSRLARVLHARDRTALNRRLLLRTLAVVSGWSGAPRHTIVVSPSWRALALARAAGATSIREGTRAAGLNRAVRLGFARAAAQGATHALVLPIDLPFLRARALRALTQAARGARRLVLAPDRAGTGTNALLLETGVDFRFAFGPDSFDAHHAAAGRAGLEVVIVRHPDLQFDLDTPADLAAVTGSARREGNSGLNCAPQC